MKALCVAVAASVVFASACGGGQRMTRAGYALALNRVCSDANATLEALGSTRTIGNAEALMAASRHGRVKANGSQIENLYRQATADFGKIPPPAGEKGTAGQFIDTSRQLTKTMKQAFDLADSGDQTAFADADRELSYLETKAGLLAHRLGAHACAPRE